MSNFLYFSKTKVFDVQNNLPDINHILNKTFKISENRLIKFNFLNINHRITISDFCFIKHLSIDLQEIKLLKTHLQNSFFEYFFDGSIQDKYITINANNMIKIWSDFPYEDENIIQICNFTKVDSVNNTLEWQIDEKTEFSIKLIDLLGTIKLFNDVINFYEFFKIKIDKAIDITTQCMAIIILKNKYPKIIISDNMHRINPEFKLQFSYELPNLECGFMKYKSDINKIISKNKLSKFIFENETIELINKYYSDIPTFNILSVVDLILSKKQLNLELVKECAIKDLADGRIKLKNK